MRTLFAGLLLSGLAADHCLACLAQPQESRNPPATKPAGRHVPALGAVIDDALKKGTIPQASLNKVLELREKMAALSAAGDQKQARAVEEEAMHILGYVKRHPHCGPYAFYWESFERPQS